MTCSFNSAFQAQTSVAAPQSLMIQVKNDPEHMYGYIHILTSHHFTFHRKYMKRQQGRSDLGHVKFTNLEFNQNAKSNFCLLVASYSSAHGDYQQTN